MRTKYFEKLEKAEEEILERIATWISEGSGWTMEEILVVGNLGSRAQNAYEYAKIRAQSTF